MQIWDETVMTAGIKYLSLLIESDFLSQHLNTFDEISL